jgi:xanthosine utilization system XapX-like protein
MKFAIAGKNNGTTTFTGATQAAGRFSYTLTYAAVPAPGAAALVGLAGMIVRRRSRA